jgi:hypothetical protein
MTIEVGARNPGAVGVYFGGANQSDIHNVSIVSEDGGGVVGLDDSIGTVLSYQRDLTVRGFDVGVRMVPYHFTEPALEHVTLRGQRRAGVELVNGTASLRWVDSVNSAPAVLVSDGGAHVVVLDSSFRGGATSAAAVTLSAGPNGIGHAFVRDVTVGGYGCGARTGNRCARAGSITGASCTDAEWSSDAPLRFSSTRPSTLCSLRLPVVEPPVVPVETDARRWSAPSYTAADFEAGRNASPSVQAAMTAGCPAACPTTVYLPAYAYALDTTVTIPCSVKRVTGLFTKLGGAAGTKLRVAEACSSPLVIEDITFEGGTAVEHAAMRPLVMERVDTQAFVYDSAVASGRPRVWLDMVGGFKALRPFHDVEAYVRAGNAESHVGSFVADANAKLWVLGFKTEKDPTQFTVRNGGQLEVLGGIFNQYCQSGCDFPSSVAVDVSGAGSKVSIVAATNGPPSTTQHFHTIIAETQGSTTRTLAWDDPALPRRAGRAGQIIVPLYASY